MTISRLIANLVALSLIVWSGCGDASNPPVRDIELAPDSTFTQMDAVHSDPIRLHIRVAAPQMLQFRAWSVGHLVGATAELRDGGDNVVWSHTSPGTSLRLDGIRVDAPGRYTFEVKWTEGAGVAGYRYSVLSTGISPVAAVAAGALQVARVGHQATALSNGQVLITGGWQVGSATRPGGVSMSSAEVYDPLSGESAAVSDMTQPRAGHSAVSIESADPNLDGRVLIMGGIGPKGDAMLSTEIYDPETGEFAPGPFLPEPRAFLQAVKVNGTGSFLDGKVLLGGGERTRAEPQHDFDQQLYSEVDENPRELWFFDANAGTIQNFDQLEFGRMGMSMTLLGDGRILFVGGGVDTLPSAPACDQTLPLCTCTSSQIPLCTLFEKCDVDDCIYTNFARKDVGHRSVEVYDTASGARVTLDKSAWMNRGRVGHAAAALPGNRLVVVGGATAHRRSFHSEEYWLPEVPQTLDSVELYDPTVGYQGEWRVLPHVTVPREQAILAPLGDRVVLVGGFESTPTGMRGVSLVELWEPSKRHFVAWDSIDVGRGALLVAPMTPPGLLLLGGENQSGPVAAVERLVVLESTGGTTDGETTGETDGETTGETDGVTTGETDGETTGETDGGTDG